MEFSDILSGYAPYETLVESVAKHNTPISLSGITQACIPHLAFQLFHNTGKNMLIITYSDSEAAELHSRIRLFYENAVLFPAKEYIFYNIETTNHQKEHDRIAAIDDIRHADKGIIAVASVDAVISYTADMNALDKYTVEIGMGSTGDVRGLADKLVERGCAREDIAEGKGQFSIRGGILDIFPSNSQSPVRIEFFDDEVDSIRLYDSYTQRSEENIEYVRIAPATEMLFDKKRRDEIILELTKRIEDMEADDGYSRNVLGTDIDNFRERFHFPSIDKYVSMIYNGIPTILDYFGKDDIIAVLDSKRIKERGEYFDREKK